MNLKTIRVRIANQIYGQAKDEQQYEIRIPEESIQSIHGVIGHMWPDCQVDFKWWGKDLQDCFIFGMPVNQRLDESLLEDGEMELSKYVKKWYGH